MEDADKVVRVGKGKMLKVFLHHVDNVKTILLWRRKEFK